MATDVNVNEVITVLQSYSIPDIASDEQLLKLIQKKSYVDTRFGEFDGRRVQHDKVEFAIELRKVEHVDNRYYARLCTETQREEFVLAMDAEERDEFAKELTDIEHVAVYLQ